MERYSDLDVSKFTKDGEYQIVGKRGSASRMTTGPGWYVKQLASEWKKDGYEIEITERK